MGNSFSDGESVCLPAQIGEVIGAYRLDEVIARGGMGCVYSATHLKLDRKVAIKVLLNELASDANYVERFFHEARIVNAVRHPNIVDIHDFIELEEPHRVAYVMDLLEGPTLRHLLSYGPLTETQTANICIQLASALGAVHQVGVVHRDLKPANVLVIGSVDSDFESVPSIKLLDFGVAKRPDWLATTTMPGQIAGTPAYMSPELIDGQAMPASDVYALGCLVYEMLTGERLFVGEPRNVLSAKLGNEPVEIKLPPDLFAGEQFHALIKACVDPTPERRPNISSIIGGLEQILIDIQKGATSEKIIPLVQTKRAHTPWPLPKNPPDLETSAELRRAVGKRRPSSVLVALGMAAFLLAAGLVFWARTSMHPTPEPTSEPMVAELHREPAPTPEQPPARELEEPERTIEPVVAPEPNREIARDVQPEPERHTDRPREVEPVAEEQPQEKIEITPAAPATEEEAAAEAEPEPEPDDQTAEPLRRDDLKPW